MEIEKLLNHLSKTADGPLIDATGLEPALYWDPSIASLEEENIFRNDWVCPGLAAEIPNSGDYLTYSIAGEAIYCIRDNLGKIRSYSNVCRHRMMQLLEGSGSTSRVVCP